MVEILATHKENDYKYTNLSIFYWGSKALLKPNSYYLFTSSKGLRPRINQHATSIIMFPIT